RVRPQRVRPPVRIPEAASGDDCPEVSCMQQPGFEATAVGATSIQSGVWTETRPRHCPHGRETISAFDHARLNRKLSRFQPVNAFAPPSPGMAVCLPSYRPNARPLLGRLLREDDMRTNGHVTAVLLLAAFAAVGCS